MGWARFDDMRAMNRKLREAGFAARGLDEAAICQVAADMTDGHISRSTVEMLAAAHGERQWKRLVERLVKAGRWEVNGSGWYIHDFLEFNPSRAERLAERAKKQAAGRRGGQASVQARASADGQANAQAVPSRPVPKGQDSRLSLTNEQSEQPVEKPENLATQQTGDQKLAALAYRLVDTCRGYENPRLVRSEANAVIAWAMTALDTRVIDQAIGEAAQWTKPPVLPRAVAAQILLKANDCHIPLEPFQPRKHNNA